MSFTEEYEICNLALHKAGHNVRITKEEFTNPPEGNVAALSCSALYEVERDMMLARIAWNFAVRRIEYDIENYQDTITAITAAKPPVVTGTDISDAGILDDLAVYISDTDITEYDGQVFVAKNVNDGAETFELYMRDGATPFDGSSLSAATEGYVRLADVLTEYQYIFKLPDNCLRVFQMPESSYYIDEEGDTQADLSEAERYTVENGYLFTDEEDPKIKYIEKITDVSKFPSHFILCLATKMAAELAVAVAEKPDKKLKLLEELEKVVMPDAKWIYAVEKRTKTQTRNFVRSWRKRY